MLYNIDKLPSKMAKKAKAHAQKKEIIEFFVPFNMAKNHLLTTVYATDKDPFCFVDEATLLNVSKKAQALFGEHFDLVSFYSEADGYLLKREETSVEFQKFTVHSEKDFQRIKDLHSEHSTYGQNKNKANESIRVMKKEKNEKVLSEIEDRKQKESEEFKRKASLSRVFDGKTIVSVDFEFRYIRSESRYMITEVGFSTRLQDKSLINEHFLVLENYANKLNRSLQDKFEFGKTNYVKEDQLAALLTSRIQDADYLLFHEQREDMEIFKQLGVKVNKEILDTQIIYSRNFKPKGEMKADLKTLIDFCHIKAEYLHNAGNDAKYTMDLFLKMVDIKKVLVEAYKKANGLLSENEMQPENRQVERTRKMKM